MTKSFSVAVISAMPDKVLVSYGDGKYKAVPIQDFIGFVVETVKNGGRTA